MEDKTDWRSGETRQSTTASDDNGPPAAQVPGLTILAHPDPWRVGERRALPVLAFGHAVRLSRLEPVFRQPEGSAEQPGLQLAERAISRQPIHLL